MVSITNLCPAAAAITRCGDGVLSHGPGLEGYL